MVGHFKITLAYDGTDFVGWQRQAAGTSIQGLIEDALGALDGDTVTVTGAGRTDAGVHALGQAASFALRREIDADGLIRAMNARLPDTIRILTAHPVPPRFNARFAALGKRYRYRICNGPVISPFERHYALHVRGALDVPAMAVAAAHLEGCHDFASFQASGSDAATTERAITTSQVVVETAEDAAAAGWRHGGRGLRGERLITYEIAGNGFLRHMVRNIAGTLLEVGHGRRAASCMSDVLARRDRSAAGPTAPARGLFLVGVDYGTLAAEP